MPMPARTTSAGSVEAAIRALRGRVRGQVVRPDDSGYDQARRVWNTAVDRHPALIVRPHDVADVVAAVDFARTEGVPLAVRGGGHSPAGHGTVDDGLVVDMSGWSRLEIDPERREARAGPGLTWGEYNARTHVEGLATPGGDVAAVGVAGLTLAGGMGWLMRKHGLTIDNLLEVDLVTADGRHLTVNDAEHPDLYWALRGGGGNFGIATGFRYRLHPVGTVLGGALVYPATREGLRAYAEVAATAPDGLTTITLVGKAPPLPFVPAEAHGTPIHLIVPCFVGDAGDRDGDGDGDGDGDSDSQAGERALAPLRSLARRPPLADTDGPRPYPAR
jgi:FAD/FMN-containing dehydrogenase